MTVPLADIASTGPWGERFSEQKAAQASKARAVAGAASFSSPSEGGRDGVPRPLVSCVRADRCVAAPGARAW